MEVKNIDLRRFLEYVCQIAKVRVRINFGWVSIFTQKYVKGMTMSQNLYISHFSDGVLIL